jgi:hypothetical protein
MPIKIVCQCGRQLIVPDQRAGRAVQCPKCNQRVEVPGERLPDPPRVETVAKPAAAVSEPIAPKAAAPTPSPPAPKKAAPPKPPPPPRAPKIETVKPSVPPAPPMREKAAAPTPPPVPPPPPAIELPKIETTRTPPLPPDAPLPKIELAKPPAPLAPIPPPPPKPPAPKVELPPPPAPQRPEPSAPSVPASVHLPAAVAAKFATPPIPKATEPEKLKEPEKEKEPLVSTRMGYRPDAEKINAAYVLTMLLVLLGFTSLAPGVYDIVRYLRDTDSGAVGRWVFVVFFLGLMHFAYGFYLGQLPDWSSAWVLTGVTLLQAAVYAAVLTALYLTGGQSQFVEGLDLRRYVDNGHARAWCFVMMCLTGMAAYFCGRVSIRWRRAFVLVRSAYQHDPSSAW